MSTTLKTAEVSELTSFIWSIADTLWGDFTHSDFDRIIMPFLLLRRLECVLSDTKEKVLEVYSREKDSGMDLEMLLPEYSGYPFYNTSQYSLETIGSTNTKSNLEQYISSFSAGVCKIFSEFGFHNSIIELDKAGLLYLIASKFASIDLHPNVVSDRVMSNTYERLIRDFAASINMSSGEFMSPFDAVHALTTLVVGADEEIFNDKGVIRSIYDPTCGTGGFLFDAIDEIHRLSNTVKVVPFGQELNPKTHAMAMTAMMFRGYDTVNIKQGNTLSDDQLKNKRFHYCLSNPPFGIKWEKDKKAVLEEHKVLGLNGRFGAGLPRVSDGSMLFMMHVVSKMELPENGGGRAGIILSGSPLFTGDAGSGESEIRRWLFENDYVEAIIALPTDMFYNTGIGTYAWILSNKKEAHRKGKVQLINLVDTWTSMRKSEGSKRRFISQEQIEQLVHEYDEFVNSKRTKIFKTTDFAYRKMSIKRPLRAALVFTNISVQALQAMSEFKALDVKIQGELLTKMQLKIKELWALNGKPDASKSTYVPLDFFEGLSADKASPLNALKKPFVTMITKHFTVRDEALDIVLDKKGNPVIDTSLNDNETIAFGEDPFEYFEREVKPHVPDAMIDETVCDPTDGKIGLVGYEINFNRYFYEYTPPRALVDINADLKASEARIQALLEEVTQ
jgi:type I restriction enzyme M protein